MVTANLDVQCPARQLQSTFAFFFSVPVDDMFFFSARKRVRSASRSRSRTPIRVRRDSRSRSRSPRDRRGGGRYGGGGRADFE